MGSNERLTVKEVAAFFDELAQEYLDPFNWDPNPQLEHAQKRIFTIKDFFIAKYHGRICMYFKEDIEVCRINFHEIFSGNLIYISQLDDLKNKIKRIVNSDNFYIKGEMSSNANSNNSITSNISNTNVMVVDNLDKFGGFKGDIDAAQLPKGLDETRKIIETKQIIEKSDQKIMDYLIPSRYVSHNVSIEKRDDRTTNTFNATNTTTNTGTGNRTMTNKRGALAVQELQALGVRLRRLRAEFIEQFNPLFHAI